MSVGGAAAEETHADTGGENMQTPRTERPSPPEELKATVLTTVPPNDQHWKDIVIAAEKKIFHFSTDGTRERISFSFTRYSH